MVCKQEKMYKTMLKVVLILVAINLRRIESDSDIGGDQPQENTRRNAVSDKKRREIFDALLARARNT